MSLGTEYFLMVFCSALGFIQIASAKSRLKGLLVSQKPALNQLIAGILLVPGAFFFFTWNYRNPVGIIEGSQQAGLFSLAVLAAIGATAITASVLNHTQLKSNEAVPSGLEALKSRTFLQAMVARLKKLKWKH